MKGSLYNISCLSLKNLFPSKYTQITILTTSCLINLHFSNMISNIMLKENLRQLMKYTFFLYDFKYNVERELKLTMDEELSCANALRIISKHISGMDSPMNIYPKIPPFLDIHLSL